MAILFAKFEVLTGLFLGALGLTIAILLMRVHRYMSRQRREDSAIVRTPRPKPESRGHHLDAPAEVLRWEVQMHETARELSAQLDSKMRALRTLIAEADRAADRLKAAAGKSPDLTRQPERPGPPPSDQAEALKSARHRQEEIYTLADYGLAAAEIAGRTGSPVGEVELILGLRGKR